MLPNVIKKVSDVHIPLKHLLIYVAVLLIILYFFKEQELFDRILMMLIPFIIGINAKVGLSALGIFA
jgi:hypothetical protein